MAFQFTEGECCFERESPSAAGIEYEWKLAGLWALRVFKEGLIFKLFSNVKKVKPLDDIVLQLPGTPPSICFFQLKCSNAGSISGQPFMSDDGDYSLKKYFKGFSTLHDQSKELSNLVLNTTSENWHVAIYTTKDVKDLRKHQSQKDFPLEDIFNTSNNGPEDIFSFDPSCPKFGALIKEDGKKSLYQNEFLESLKVFCNQEHSDCITYKIEDELVDIFGSDAKNFIHPFETSLRLWSEDRIGSGLSNEKILGFFKEQLRNTAEQSVCYDLKCTDPNAPGLCATEVFRDVGIDLNKKDWLYVNASIFRGFKSEALIEAVRTVKIVIHDVVRRIDEMLDHHLTHNQEVSANVLSDKEAALKGERLALLGFPKYILEEAAQQLGILKSVDTSEKIVKDNIRWTVLNFQGEPAPKDIKGKLMSLMREKSVPGVHLVEYLSGSNVDDVRVKWRDSVGRKEAMQTFVLTLTKECVADGPVCLHKSLVSLEYLERFLLVDAAGNRKPETIACFASELQKKYSTQSIIFVNILKYQQLLKKWKKENEVTVHHVVELLAAAMGSETRSARRFLENSIKQKGAMSVLIDGADDVAPVLKDITTRLLKKLLEQPVEKVWVATRPESLVACKQGSTPLYDAVCHGNIPRAKSLLNGGADANGGSQSPLIEAVRRNNHDMIKLLLDNRANVNRRNKNNYTAVHYAVKKNDEEAVKLLIDARADITLKNNSGKTAFDFAKERRDEKILDIFLESMKAPPLHRAVIKGDAKTVASLLKESSTDLNARDIKGCTALHFSSREEVGRKHDRILKMLLNKQYVDVLDVDAEDEDGLTPLYYATDVGCVSCVELILDRGANVDGGSKSPLIHASERNHIKIISLLINKEASVNTRGEMNFTALHYAVKNNNAEAVQLLIEKGADIKLKNEDEQIAFDFAEKNQNERILDIFLQHMDGTAIHRAINNRNRETVASLLNNSASDLNARDIKGRTALHFALGSNGRRHEHEISQMMLQNRSVVVDAKDEDGLTPLYYATDVDCVSCVESILNQEANVDGGSKSPLIQASERNNINIIRLLLDKGASVNRRGKCHYTALHYAVEMNNEEAVQLLIERRADITLENKLGKTAFDFAEERQIEKILNLFHKHMKTTPLHRAVIKDNATTVASLLKESRSDINARDIKGRTALHLALGSNGRRHQDEISHMLLNNKSVDVDAQDEDGLTPLYYATDVGCVSCVESILNQGANVDRGSKSPLIQASERNHINIIRCLLGKKASVNGCDERRYTALHYAVENDNEEAVKLLIDGEADIKLKSYSGKTAFDLAEKRRNEKILDMFLQCMEGTGIHRAINKRNKAMVESLLNEPTSDFNARDIKGRTALHFALGLYARSHEHDICRLILQNTSVDVDARDEDGLTPLEYATRVNCDSCTKLIQSRAKFDDWGLKITRYLVFLVFSIFILFVICNHLGSL